MNTLANSKFLDLIKWYPYSILIGLIMYISSSLKSLMKPIPKSSLLLFDMQISEKLNIF